MSKGYSRRELFSRFLRPARRRTSDRPGPLPPTPGSPAGPPSGDANDPVVAIIQGRFCLAYDGMCSVCVDACPVPGALPVANGIPQVDRGICTGCGVCQDVCPASPNAVLLMPREVGGQP